MDTDFYNGAKRELDKLGVCALDLLNSSPNKSKRQLAQSIGNGVTARGLTIALFEEARAHSAIASLAKELLYRKIIQEFPDGWHGDDNIHTAVRLGSWYYDVHEFAPEFQESAASILKALATTNIPEEGWKPESADDEFLRELFRQEWEIGA